MDLRDLVKLAGIVNPEVLNKLEPTVEADGAGFEDATTRPQEEMMDDPMATMGSDADLSLRRYLKAKGDHVTVDEEVYPDHTVESVTEAYAAFKAESATPNLDKEIAAYFKQIGTPAKGFGGKLKAEASIGAPDYNPAAGKYASNMIERVVLGAEDGGITISMDGKDVGVASDPEELAKLLSDMGVDNNTDIMHSSSVDFASEEGFESDGAAHEFIDQAMEIMGIDESAKLPTNEGRFKDMYTELEELEPEIIRLKNVYIDKGMEPEEAQDMACEKLGCDPEMFDEYLTQKDLDEANVDENAFNQAAAAAARAGKDSFEFGGKTHKTTMKKDVAHKLDDDVDMLRKLAGL